MDFGSEIMVEPLPLLGVCILCLNDGAVKSLFLAQKHDGIDETYVDMLIKCFSIDLTAVELGDMKALICSTCIVKLRDALSFREQVECSLKTLHETVKMNNVKQEESIDNKDVNEDFNEDDPGADAVDSLDEDDTVLMLIKKEVKEEDTQPRKTRNSVSKSKLKLITLNSRKPIDLHETEVMLEAGLIPFKMRKDKKYFTCAICPERSTNLDDLKNHIKDHTKKNIHFAFKKMLFSNSQRFYKSSTKLRCKLCTTDVSDYEELKNHIENCTRLKYSCKWNHLPFKLEKDQLDCPVCKKTFLNFVSLNTHMNEHYPNYICESCGKAFASKARLRGHMRTHEVGEFPCKYCNAVFDRVTKRENHVSKEHKAGVRYACKRCNISLSSFYARQKHLAEVHNEELKRYKCKACPQSYITPGHLSSHVRRDHLNERNHKCDKCDLAFYTKNALKMHMIKHDGERIHSCHICQKSYQRKKTLREHMRIHNNDKRFVCPVCGRAFTQKCTLKGHLKVHGRKLDVDERIVPLHSI